MSSKEDKFAYAREIYDLLISHNSIPIQGRTLLSPKLIDDIINAEQEILPADSPADRAGRKEAAAIIFASYAKWMPQEVEATLEFVDKVITDRMDLSLNATELIRHKAKQPEEQKKTEITESKSRNLMMSGNRAEAEGNDKQALDFFNQSIECRDNIEPIIRRGMYHHERLQNKEALDDFCLAISEAKQPEHRLAFAYAERGLMNLELSLTKEGLVDLIRGFRLFAIQLESVNEVNEPPESYIGTVEYFIDRCSPALKALESKDGLTREEESSIKTLQEMITDVRDEITDADAQE